MMKSVVRGMLVVGAVTLSGALLTGCASSGEKKEASKTVDGTQVSSSSYVRFLTLKDGDKIVETKVETVDATATAVKDIYVTLLKLANARDAAYNNNAAFKQYTDFIEYRDEGGNDGGKKKRTQDETAAFIAKQNDKEPKGQFEKNLGEARVQLTQAGLSADALQELLAKTVTLGQKVTSIASNPQALVTNTGFGAVLQGKDIAKSAKHMTAQLAASTGCLPIMIADAMRLAGKAGEVSTAAKGQVNSELNKK